MCPLSVFDSQMRRWELSLSKKSNLQTRSYYDSDIRRVIQVKLASWEPRARCFLEQKRIMGIKAAEQSSGLQQFGKHG